MRRNSATGPRSERPVSVGDGLLYRGKFGGVVLDGQLGELREVRVPKGAQHGWLDPGLDVGLRGNRICPLHPVAEVVLQGWIGVVVPVAGALAVYLQVEVVAALPARDDVQPGEAS